MKQKTLDDVCCSGLLCASNLLGGAGGFLITVAYPFNLQISRPVLSNRLRCYPQFAGWVLGELVVIALYWALTRYMLKKH